jgi:hypothetical protein
VGSLVIGGALIASSGDCAFAQIVPDTTLGSENSRVTPIRPTIDQINGGATRGTNLFHDGAEVNVSSTGTGIAGELRVEADAIRLDNQGKINADTSGGGEISIFLQVI